MTLVDILQTYNVNHGYDIDDMGKMYENIDIDDRIDKDILVDCLLDECGACRVLYSTTGVFKRFSDNFFKKYKWNIEKLLDTLELKYDPLSNMNLEWIETTKIEQKLETVEERAEGRIKENTGTQGKANTGTEETEYNDDKTNTISAMNSNDYEPDNKSKTIGSNTRTDNLNEVTTDNLKEEIAASKSGNKNEELGWDETDKHTESGSKDIVLQDLINKERAVAEFSIYNWISKKYKNELCLLVY